MWNQPIRLAVITLMVAGSTALGAQSQTEQVITTRDDSNQLTRWGFDQADPNKDGVLTWKEWERRDDAQIAAWGDLTPKEKTQFRADSRDFFRLVDANKDGRVSRAELTGWYDKFFECLDENRDNSLTSGESERGDLRCSKAMGLTIRADPGSVDAVPTDPPPVAIQRAPLVKEAGEAFDRHDTDHDGFLIPTEWLEAVPDRSGFAAFDKDRDGQISKQEYVALALSLFDCMDSDRNGTASEPEIEGAGRKCLEDLRLPFSAPDEGKTNRSTDQLPSSE